MRSAMQECSVRSNGKAEFLLVLIHLLLFSGFLIMRTRKNHGFRRYSSFSALIAP
jgi:hypothetical protein